MLSIHALLGATALSMQAVQASPAPLPSAQETPPRRVRITVTTIVNGSPSGEVPIEVGIDGSDPRVAAAPLLAKVERVLAPAALNELRSQLGTGELVSVSEFANSALRVSFNMAELRLYVDVSVASRNVNELSIVTPSEGRGPSAPPGDFSGGVTFSLANRFRHQGNFGDIRRDPLNVLAEGFFNAGGIDGISLLYQAGYQERGKLVRGRTTLIQDDVARAIRYSAGDVDPQYFGSFSNATSVLGVGVQRLYETIQPFRNIRPSGQGRLTLETPSRVDVIVNGAVYRTLDLAPGQYSLRDFPYLNGVNDVRLVARDAAGREETIILSFFSDAQLLQPGISVFSATLGLPRNQFGSFQTTTYNRRSPQFSGFFQRGLTSGLTVGGALQFDKDNGLISSQTILGSTIGTFVFEGALDIRRNERLEGAASAGYRLQTTMGDNRILNIDFDVRHMSPRFSPMETGRTSTNPYTLELNARGQAQVAASTFVNLSAGYSVGRTGFADRATMSVGVSRRIGRFNVGANYSYRKEPTRSEHRGVLSISLPLSSREYARTSYETDRNRFSASYDRQAFEALGETEIHATGARSDDGLSANAEITHYANRFRADLRHSYDDTGGSVRQFTDAAIRFGIAFEGDRVALGRDAYPGFIMIERHRTLGKSPVLVSDGFAEGPVAKADGLGPALMRVRRAYQPTSVSVAVKDLPAGYDIGAGRFDILPGAASGYRFMIGSAASNTVIGRLEARDGTPLSLVAGTLQPISGAEAAAAQFFTNRTGRMVATRVAPGRYRIVLNGESQAIGEIEVPEDPKGPINFGTLTRSVEK